MRIQEQNFNKICRRMATPMPQAETKAQDRFVDKNWSPIKKTDMPLDKYLELKRQRTSGNWA